MHDALIYGFNMTGQGCALGVYRPTYLGARPNQSELVLHVVVKLVGCTEMNIQFSGNCSGGHSCSQHANCTHPQHLRHLCRCVTKLHILKWPFIVPSTRCTCVMIMLFNQLLDMPHLSGGWIVLAKEKCSLTGM